MTREFISYASEYDLYSGTLDWNDLTHTQQDEIIEALTSTAGDPLALVMTSKLKRRQEEGLRAVIVFTSLMLENNEQIRAMDWSPMHRLSLRTALAETPVGQRLWEAWESSEDDALRTPLSGEMLERLAQHGMNESPLNVIVDLGLNEAEEILKANIGIVPPMAEIETAPTLRILELTWSDLTHQEKTLILDSASSGNAAAIQTLRTCRQETDPELRYRALRTLERIGSWRPKLIAMLMK
jgi:hypothetical protein